MADVWQPPYEAPLRTPGLSVAYEGKDARIYANENALPRASWSTASSWSRPRMPPSTRSCRPTSVRSRRRSRRSRSRGSRTSGQGESGGRARITSYEPEEVDVEAALDEPGLLVLSDVHYPGWRAEVDGREVPIERVDHALRGVPLSAGSHTVAFRYEPLSWRIGWIVSLLGLALLAAAVVAGLRGRRRGTTASARPQHTQTGAP